MKWPMVVKPWMLCTRVALWLCVWPLVMAGQHCASQRPFTSGLRYALRPSEDGQLLFLKSHSHTAGKEVYAIFDWKSRALRAVDRRDTAFVEPDEEDAKRGVMFDRLYASMDRDPKNGWLLVSDGRRTFVCEEATKTDLFTIDERYVLGRFIPSTKHLVYLDQHRRLFRVSLPSGTIEDVHDLQKAYAACVGPWLLGILSWLFAWLLLWSLGGGWVWLDTAALSLATLALSSAFYQPLLVQEQDRLTLALFSSLAILAGLGIGALPASWAMTMAIALSGGATLAHWTFLATNEASAAPGISVLLAVGMATASTIFFRAAGRGVTRPGLQKAEHHRPRPRASLFHFFLLTASCAYLLVILQWLTAASVKPALYSLDHPLITAAVGAFIGIAVYSVGLLGRFGWLVFPLGVGLGLAQLDPPIWFILFTCHWMYLLRCAGFRCKDLQGVA